MPELVTHAGRRVTPAERRDAVWPDTSGPAEGLKSHLCDVRRALGDRAPPPRLREPGARRGDQFIAAVGDVGAAAPAAPSPRPALPRTKLPAPAADLIGRATALAAVADQVRAQRLVTLTGAGGIGQTRLGREGARPLLPDLPDDVWRAALAALSEADLVADAVAAALGLDLAGGVASPG